ncbi:BTAD domain-containing putative transcriptional regulator [Kutzneria buriramensis]|uniref:DNA-binding SARP family transcriptional activator n=1 Tax=Kutzneria buriramensis TaxID=1045776 RepID=A0A3E0HHT2_9PSEU|nr:BTAD domain-containing putative transcriptional regulator [Kutzneria buriramensis]REH46044.1 DNA-binding SARP family transcriptional activator [Kutzneria buriramensis]
MAVEFRLLGEVEVYHDGEPVPIGYAQLRCMLAVLLVEANCTVSVDHIIDRVWGERRLPRNPRAAVQHNITVLRKALADVGFVQIIRRSAGYQLCVDAATVDLHRFAPLLDQARAAQEDEPAAKLFAEALRLWRGEPCAGLDAPWLDSLRVRLAAQRQAALLDLVDIRMRLGEHEALQAELADHVQQQPLDERLAGQYMLALYRGGRQAHALDHYQRLRRDLADQLGIDPGQPIRRLYEQMLNADPTLAAESSRSVVTAPPVSIPRQLPAAPRLFTGRRRELDQLTASNEPGATMAISAIRGVGGIGKTWLALHWAHQHLGSFPDGQLHVDLRGFDPTGRPMSVGTAVRTFLGALGVEPLAVPPEEEAQVGLYRSLLAGKRVLIVLDNARDADQVIPLLPGSSTCTVLITSRNRLTGLVTRHGAHVVDLDALSTVEAWDLLSGHLGADRLAAEPQPAADLLDGCAGLPLALSIVAARAASHPGFPLESLADELRDHAGRLDTLDGGELSTNLRAVLSWSFHALDADAAAVFELLGLVPGPDISVAAVASLAALPDGRTRVLLRRLEDASLVQEHTMGRFRMHNLVRLYAGAEADSGDTDALRRLADFYLHTAFSAEQLLLPLQPPLQLDEPAAGCRPGLLVDQTTALAWFDVEHPNLLAVQRMAADRGWAVSVWQLARIMTTFLYRQGRFRDALTLWRAGQLAADQLGDPVIQTGTHQLLGVTLSELGEYDEALHHLNLAERLGDSPSTAYTQHALGWLWSLKGDNRRALTYAGRALRRYREQDILAGEIRERTVSCWYHALLGEFEDAAAQCRTALAIARHHHHAEDEGLILGIQGFVAFHTGRHAAAVDHFERSVPLLRGVGNAYYEATVLDHLGQARNALGETESACHAWQQALHLYEAQHRTAEADQVGERLGRPRASA